ncbi:unnamed protein product [Cylicocyclus nassatus]|uniref:StAR-related lipid transfer protein 3 n=1 Tax=Cylicocyclus nassatus TaxID=53992 RepID=A0AA36GUV4_CYLNA|nr:unnamed protein product [Cylicocyclus nassatus]
MYVNTRFDASLSEKDVPGLGKRGIAAKMSGRSPLLGSDSPGLSKDRRRFIIISIFDATLTTLLWLLCTVSKGDDWPTVFLQEINIFDSKFMSISLFDIVLCAVLRMVVLILLYAVFVVRHWLPVAITTSLSTVYIVIKILFFFSHKQGGLPQYLLVLASFSIAWFELWLMPFKVLPGERRCEHNDSLRDDLSVSVRGNSFREPRPNQTPRYISEDEFRSAMEFSSEDEALRSHANRPLLRGSQISAELRDTCEKVLRDASEKVDTLLRQARMGEWKVLKVKDPMVLQAPDLTYYVRAEFGCPPQVLFDAAWKDVMRWNTQLVEARVISILDSVTDLYYSMTAPALKGYVASRDFFDVRRIHFDSAMQTYSGVFVSIESAACPIHANKKIVRGANGPGCIRAVGDITTPGQSALEWLIRTDLKGGLPKRLIQSTMLTYFIEHITRLREYIDGQSGTRAASS